MTNLLRISEAASLALHTMVLLSADPDQLISARGAASTLNVSEAHLSKVMQRLSKAGLVKSHRGPGGGFKLGKPAGKITLLDIYEAIEGPLVPLHCLLGLETCVNERCFMNGLLESVNSKVRNHLAKTKLDIFAS